MPQRTFGRSRAQRNTHTPTIMANMCVPLHSHPHTLPTNLANVFDRRVYVCHDDWQTLLGIGTWTW